MNEKEYIYHAISESQGNASLWFRYLNKMLNSKQEEIYKSELQALLLSNSVNPFQKATVKVILSDPNWLAFTKGLSKKADTSWVKEKYGL